MKNKKMKNGCHVGDFKIISYVYHFQGEHLYRCICEKCGLENILTPSEMLKHTHNYK